MTIAKKRAAKKSTARKRAKKRVNPAPKTTARKRVGKNVARKNPVAEPARIASLRASIRSYFTLARRTSERMIAGETGDSIFAALNCSISS